MAYYPLYLNLENRLCVVVGGGEVAQRKVERLVECGARVRVVARFLTPALARMRERVEIEHVNDEYRCDYVEGAVLVIGATDRVEINERIYKDGHARGLLVNIVDNPPLCNCIVPSLFQRGNLAVAVSTGGKSPALARRIREEIEERYGNEYAILLDIMGELRCRILSRGMPSEKNRGFFEALLDSEILDLIIRKDWQGVEKVIFECAGEEVDLTEIRKNLL